MSNPWNTASVSKSGPELLDIMTEELNQRLQIEDDFVWVNLPEVQQVEDMVAPTKSDKLSPDLMTTNESSIAQTAQKLVQSEVDLKIDDEGVTEIIYYDEDSDVYDTINHPDPDQVDDWECKIDYVRPVNILKGVYPMPYCLKQKEHGTDLKNSSDYKSKDKAANPLLPKVKFGPSTTAVLERFIERRFLGNYNEVVGRGQYSVVFHAHCHRRPLITMPCNNAVKVYHLSSNKERNKLIFKRAQREFEHLSIAHKHEAKDRISIQPIHAWENVIVMSFISGQSIEDLPLDIKSDTAMYQVIVDLMCRCYNIVHLVHGKLCARNIKVWFNRPHFIGWGHSVKTDHPRALAKQIKDCQSVTEFYSKRGLKLKSTEELFTEITGIAKISSKLLNSLKKKSLYEKYDKNPNRKFHSPIKTHSTLRFK